MATRALQGFHIDLPPRGGQREGASNRWIFQPDDRVPEALVTPEMLADGRAETVADTFWDPPEPWPGAAALDDVAFVEAAKVRGEMLSGAARDRFYREAKRYASFALEPADENEVTPAAKIEADRRGDPRPGSAEVVPRGG